MESKHSAMFNQIKEWYDHGFWTENMVKNAVIKKKITEVEFEEITKKSE